MNVILEKVSKSYGTNKVLQDITLSFESGHIYAVAGPSGAGKTTLLRLLCGLEKPDSGSIVRPSSLRFSYAFQEPRLFSQLSVRENIALTDPDRSPEDLLSCLHLSEAGGNFPDELSGGMKNRVSLARALSICADIYLFDEPTAGQDRPNADSIADAIHHYTHGALVLIATHDLTFLKRCADTLLLVRHGTISPMKPVSDIPDEELAALFS